MNHLLSIAGQVLAGLFMFVGFLVTVWSLGLMVWFAVMVYRNGTPWGDIELGPGVEPDPEDDDEHEPWRRSLQEDRE